MKNRRLNFFYLLLICISTNSCIEPFDFETISFEDALVIEATITNELKHQEIYLTRTFQFEEDAPTGESNADVKVSDDLLNTFVFEETSPGKYVSISEFSAAPSRSYELSITTRDGRLYTSTPSQLPQITQINELSLIREANTDGMDGVTIYANSFDPTGNSRFYRYEFEETYTIIPPFASSRLDVVILDDSPPFAVNISVTTQPKTQEKRVCFRTLSTDVILQTQTIGLQEDRVTRFPIHFVQGNNPIIRERYSIEVKQYVQSIEAFNYYKVLKELSGSESLLSQNQPGFINGNVVSADNPDEKVVGFFEVASVSSRRIFFNFRDIFPDLNRPPFFAECTIDSPLMVDPTDPNISPLIDKIKSDDVKHLETNFDFFGNISTSTPYVMVNRPCGDCTALGTNIKPNFWID